MYDIFVFDDEKGFVPSDFEGHPFYLTGLTRLAYEGYDDAMGAIIDLTRRTRKSYTIEYRTIRRKRRG